MFCKYCGKKIDKNSKFCEFCGRPVGKSDSKKINLEKDEDLVYIDSHDSTEFNDYDFDNVDDFSYEENFNSLSCSYCYCSRSKFPIPFG